jgi:hypothetical protein
VSESEPPQLEHLAQHIARALRRARESLLARMAQAGMTQERGWRVNEELRHTREGTEWILSPIHLREPAPGLDERVRIDAEGRLVRGNGSG